MPLSPTPACFYYSQSESREQFSTTPKGDIVIDRLMQNKPDYWLHPAPSRVQKKKKLIIANTISGCVALVNICGPLIADGFELYVWKNRMIQRITLPVTPQQFMERYLEDAVYPDEIVNEAFLQHHWNRDEIQIIDNYWLSYLINGYDKYEVYPSHLKSTSYFSDRNKKNPFLVSGRVINRICNHEFRNFNNQEALKLKKAFPLAEIVSTYSSVELEASETVNFLQAMAQNKNYSLGGLVFTPENFAHGVNLDLNISALKDTQLLITLLKKVLKNHCLTLSHGHIDRLESLPPKIWSLVFKNITLNHFSLPPGEPTALINIQFSNCIISGAHLKTLLTATPKVRRLWISNSIINDICDMPDLNELNLLRINIKQDKLIQYLLKKSPQLNTLILEGPDFKTIQSYVDSLSPLLKATIKVSMAISQEGLLPSFIPAPGIPNSLQMQSSDEFTVDAETQSDANQKRPVQRIFYSVNGAANPSPDIYRLNIYQDLVIKDKPCSIKEAFSLKKKGDLELRPCEVRRSPVDVYALAQQHQDKASQAYYGKQKLTLTKEWRPIASLSPEETLLAYHVESEIAVEFSYSQRDNLYYVRSKTDAINEVTLDFMVSVPKIKRALPAAIETLASRYETFKDTALTMTTPNPTGHDYLQAIQEQGKGVCRHRALAFKAEMKQKHPQIPVRMGVNDCHSAVEIYSEGNWVFRNLGGPETQLIFNEADELPQPNAKELPPDTSPEGRYLETWKKKEVAQESVAAFCTKIMKPTAGSKRLIELSSSHDLGVLSYLLQHQAHLGNQDILYIHSPEELVCAAPWIAKRQEGQTIHGVLTEGPGGRLYDFLMKAPRHAPRTLVINYANFKAEDVAKLNTHLDKEGKIDGIAIPAVQIVGLTNTQGEHYYSGEDFYSRFDDILPAPPSQALAIEHQLHVKEPKLRTAQDTQVTSVRLFHSLNWKNDLLGHWIMDGTRIRFEEGQLQKALTTGLPLLIHQGLWDNDEFVNFWHQAKLLGYIEHSGGVLKIPPNLQLLREDAYDWSYLTKNIQNSDTLEESAHFLNPTTFAHYFNHYTCDNNTKTLSRQTGWINAASKTAQKTLAVYLTRDLTEAQWAKLGHACHEQGVTLRVHAAPGVPLLKMLPVKPNTTTPTLVAWEKTKVVQQSTTIIQSTDVDATVALLTAGDANWFVLDITGCKGQDLLTRIQSTFDAESLSFQFTQGNQALLTALGQGKKIILKGDFTPELLDELAPLLQKRAKEQGHTTPLVLIGTNISQCHYLTTQMTHQVSVAEKENCLSRNFFAQELSILSKNLVETETLARLKARLIHQRIQPGTPTDAAWAGLMSLPIKTALTPLTSSDDTASIARSFHQQRKNQVMQGFKYAPYLYLTGLTGGGKSTFVEKFLKQDPRIAFYTSLKEWALDKTQGKMKLFFEDETNLSQRQWHELEGLFHNPPGILIEGTYYPLTPEHKVLMAGNPMTYGDERQLSPVFQRHGNALVFEALPLACIYEDLLKPVFAGTAIAPNSWAICQPFLEMYQFLLTHSKEKLLISPRELQMMALLTWSHYQQAPQDNIIDVASYYAQQVTQHIVPQAQRKAYSELPLMLKAQRHNLGQPQPRNQHQTDFLLTPSRMPIVCQLNDLLTLSELRKNKARPFNPAQLYGGLGGLILTGEAGIGKSEMVIAVLRQKGYQERHLKPPLVSKPKHAAQLGPQKIFYRMPAGLPFKVKQQLILKAFDEGAVLVADEINSSPLLERWFNDLLMGKHPLTGQPPKIPGFVLIGSQNPVTMEGRRQASQATERRLLQVTVSPYPHQEMVDILIQNGIAAARAKHLVTVYETKRSYALEHHLKPPPVFRDLLKFAELEIKTAYQKTFTTLEQTFNTLSDESIKKNAQAIKQAVGLLSSPSILTRLTKLGFFDANRSNEQVKTRSEVHESIRQEIPGL